MERLKTLSFEEMLAYTSEGQAEARITVGIFRAGARGEQTQIAVYGEGGRALPLEEHVYEIGSLTKTFTAALISRAIGEGRIGLDEPLSAYLPLSAAGDAAYPTIRQVLSHTAGYKEHYLEMPMVSAFFRGGNPFAGVTREMVLAKAADLHIPTKTPAFLYSNFGYGVLGLVLEAVYQERYKVLVNRFVAEDLGLEATYLADDSGDLAGYWHWDEGDAYAPAGALYSTIEDMLRYVSLQMDGAGPAYLKAGQTRLADIDGGSESYRQLNIHMDGVAFAWMLDEENGLVWHNGGTTNFNAYLGFSPEKQIGVVVLANLPPGHRIPATVLGVKLLTSLE